jgi:hypothetical protein
MGRMVGATFGVAVLGAIVAGVGGAKIDTRLGGLSSTARDRLTESLGAGGVQSGSAPARVVSATHDAFISALGTGMKLSGIVALAGALVAFVLIDNRRPVHPDAVPAEPAEAARSQTAVEPIGA